MSGFQGPFFGSSSSGLPFSPMQSQERTAITSSDMMSTPGGSHSMVSGGHQLNPYLPEYLLGESTSGITSPMHSHRLWSSSGADHIHGSSFKGNRSSNTVVAPQGLLDGSFTSSMSAPSIGGRMSSNRTSIAVGGGEKRGGPPTTGLFNSPGCTSTSMMTSPNRSRSFLNQSNAFALTPASTSDVNGENVNSLSPAQLDPFYTQGESLKPDEELDGTWVTVFGFPASAVSFILQQFSQYGNIIENKMSGGDNWIHLHYQSRIQAKKALSKNGKILSGNMMIGVTQCIDKGVMSESAKENANSFANSPLSFNLSKRECGSIGRSSKRITGMRPLSEAYSAAASDQAVVSGNGTPQKKSGGVVNKAMEYVFGW